MSEMEWLDIFSNNLASIMDSYRMTQKELSDETGLSTSSISHYLNKQRIPNIKAIINISYALNCSLDDLLDFGDTID